MNRYPKTPRVAFGFAAVALSALTFGVAVVAPSTTLAHATAPSLAATAMATGATQAAINPGRIEVVGVRPATLADARSPANASRRQPG